MRGGPARGEVLVLRNFQFGESSKITSVLSREHGKVKLVARGARRPGHRWGNLLEPGNELEVQLYPRADRDLWTLGDATLVRAALTGGGSLDKLSHLFAALELADRLLSEREPAEEISGIYRRFLDRWHAAEVSSMAPLFFALEFELLGALGLGLNLVHCGECGRSLSGEERVQYRAEEGSFACAACGSAGGRWIEGHDLSRLARIGTALADRAVSPLDESQRRVLGRLLHEHMAYHLSSYRVPRSLYWLSGDVESA